MRGSLLCASSNESHVNATLIYLHLQDRSHQRKSSSTLFIILLARRSSAKHQHHHSDSLGKRVFAGMCLSIASCVIRIAVWHPKNSLFLFSRFSRALSLPSNNPHLQFFGCCRPIQTIVARTSRCNCGVCRNIFFCREQSSRSFQLSTLNQLISHSLSLINKIVAEREISTLGRVSDRKRGKRVERERGNFAASNNKKRTEGLSHRNEISNFFTLALNVCVCENHASLSV
jgi:hypothetical protein